MNIRPGKHNIGSALVAIGYAPTRESEEMIHSLQRIRGGKENEACRRGGDV
jgi:hypothetical protein